MTDIYRDESNLCPKCYLKSWKIKPLEDVYVDRIHELVDALDLLQHRYNELKRRHGIKWDDL